MFKTFKFEIIIFENSRKNANLLSFSETLPHTAFIKMSKLNGNGPSKYKKLSLLLLCPQFEIGKDAAGKTQWAL